MADVYFDIGSMPKEGFDEEQDLKSGAMIGLVSPGNSVQIMLVASRRGSEILAKALLGFEPDEAIDAGDLADALAEIVNIVAGMVKTVVNEQDGNLNLTLPTFMTGSCRPLGTQLVTEGRLTLGTVEAKVIVIHSNPEANAKARVSAA
ncbi:MAG: chemotaxis protein CheX [Kofleriaceae bacterium]|nr:chemotaxis protein CheX [Kofleriaceae bacterium]